jgi:hypothetical protein
MSDYPPDPSMFAQLTREENRILCMHLTSGWYKQAAVYPSPSESWRETEALLIDLSEAHRGSFQARPAARSESRASAAGPEQREPEAGQ